MELMNKWAIFVGIVGAVFVIAVSLFFKLGGKEKYVSGTKVSNTSLLKSTKLYKSLNIRFNILRGILAIGMIGSLLASLVLVARPYKNQDVYTGVKKRDIIICMDVSYSLYDLNAELTDYLKGVVKGLAGDRIGINIFNTSTVTYVPLTDDYDYVAQKLDDLYDYFVMQKELYTQIYDVYGYEYYLYPDNVQKWHDELREKLEYYDAGTLLNNNNRGSSLIGEGLGTALYSFPYIEDAERTRVIIMSTDNELNAFAGQIMNLDEASTYCKNKNVTLFAIFPAREVFYDPEHYDYDTCMNQLEKAANKTGGLLYVRTDDLPVSAIVQDIQRQEVMLVNMVMTRETQDMPQTPFIALFICLAFTCAAGLVLQK
ncbi:hypothetical protein [Butyrivibrio sp. VCB2006]|uniref:hypothetical protein n=1 Tax=Butyrivibrio sp. VCB2006 TaxID=1280679 RepID=UPI0004006859|nr:hypothetical protein [Butyrivibrio sp. VCB2006]